MKRVLSFALVVTVMALILSNNWPITMYGAIKTSANDFDCSTVSQIPQVECEAMLTLYNSTNGASWIDKTNWLVTNTPCDWFGISCLGGNIIQINLSQNQLSGSIPSALSNLANLEYLYLDNNQLSGNIPSELGSLTHLRWISLESNQISGNIPSALGNLTSLVSISFGHNQLSGSIPPEIGNLANLTSLSLNYNQLSGSIPHELGNLTELTGFFVWGNQISGSIPSEVGSLTKLESLSMAANQLSGNIPEEIGSLANLKYLYLHSNQQLTGSLPQSFTNLNNLEWFYFNNTNLCEPPDMAFQTWLASIPHLQRTSVICYVPASLAINYTTGAPNSFFTLTGSNFPGDNMATILVNGYTLGTVPADSSGDFVFLLNTDQADEGYYIVTATVNPSVSVIFMLDSTEPIRSQEGSGTIFNIPGGIAYTHIVYLPLVRK